MSLVLDDIKYFKVVSETLNITRASEIIGVSQPALSYALKRLEKELGGELFIRLKNGVQLTKLGEEFNLRSSNLLFQWEQAKSLVTNDTEDARGTYTIAVHPSVALYTLESFLPSLSNRFPNLDFKFIHGVSREMTEKVISWEADFGIVVNPIKHPDLVIKKLCRDEVTIFKTKGAKNKLILDENLAQTQYILKKLGKKNSFSGVINSSNLEVVAKLTSLGLGHGLLPSRVAHQYPKLKKLKDAPVFKDEICLIYRPEKHKSKLSKELLKEIKTL